MQNLWFIFCIFFFFFLFCGMIFCSRSEESELTYCYFPLFLALLPFPPCLCHKWKNLYNGQRNPSFPPISSCGLWRDNVTLLTNRLSSTRHTKNQHTTFQKLLNLGNCHGPCPRIRKRIFQGVPIVQWWTQLVTMRMQIWSPASISGLRIWRCHKLWCRSQTWLRSRIAVPVV